MHNQSTPGIDIVGSFLPPEKLVEARSRHAAGEIEKGLLHAIEDEAVARLVEDQIASGLTEITSGEFRRSQWDKDFWFGLEGIRRERVESGHIYQAIDPYTDFIRFMGRIAYNPDHPFFNDFAYLHEIAKGRAYCRQTLPSPANLYLEILSMTDGHPKLVYPGASRLIDDIAETYNMTMRRFYELGCRHIQLDDTACGRLCQNNYINRLLQGGVDLISVHEKIIRLLNTSVEGLPSDLEISLYISGGDTVIPDWNSRLLPDNIIPKALSNVNVGKFFLPFQPCDYCRLEVLRHIPHGTSVVLGLADAHSPFTERDFYIVETVAKASKYISARNLSVSHKTGFKLSSYLSRGLTYDSQWQKLSLLREALYA